MSWANYPFGGLEEKSNSISRLATSTDAEIVKRISESVTLYVMELSEDTFKHDTIFDSFHYQAKIHLCNVIIEKYREGNVVVNPDGGPRVKTPNPHVKLPYTYLMALYVMH